MTEQDSAYRQRVARILADEIIGAYPTVADSVATIAKTIKMRAELSLKMGRQWTAKEEFAVRSAFGDVFGKPPTFVNGFEEPASFVDERRVYLNAAIEEALEYINLVRGIDSAARDHVEGKLTDEEFVARAVQASSDSLSRADTNMDTSVTRSWLARRSHGRRT